VSDISSLSSQPFFRPIGVDLHLHSELFGKERMEKKVVIPLKIFNSDSLLMQILKLMEHGKVVCKGRDFLFGGKIFKTEEEFEKVSENHQMSDPLFLRI
jgi:hypothetical protein